MYFSPKYDLFLTLTKYCFCLNPTKYNKSALVKFCRVVDGLYLRSHKGPQVKVQHLTAPPVTVLLISQYFSTLPVRHAYLYS